MNSKLWLVSACLIGLATVASITASSGEHGGWWRPRAEDDARNAMFSRVDVPPVSSARYGEACGSCHLAYQPGLLPARSWDRIMTGLDEHFGDNAEVDTAVNAELRRYLMDNASDRTTSGRAPAFARSVAARAVPLRVTDTPYFRHKHRELPRHLVDGNPQVRSFSNCETCHRHAQQGVYDEHDIVIAGHGRWDD